MVFEKEIVMFEVWDFRFWLVKMVFVYFGEILNIVLSIETEFVVVIFLIKDRYVNILLKYVEINDGKIMFCYMIKIMFEKNW